MLDNDLIGIKGLAALIGLTHGTAKLMLNRGRLPEPDVIVDGLFGERGTKLWKESTIIEWDRERLKRYDNRKSNT